MNGTDRGGADRHARRADGGGERADEMYCTKTVVRETAETGRYGISLSESQLFSSISLVTRKGELARQTNRPGLAAGGVSQATEE